MSGLKGEFKMYFGNTDLAESEKDSRKTLAEALYGNLVRVSASETLIEKSPKTIKSIESSLKSTINKSKVEVNNGLSFLLGKDVKNNNDRDEAIVELMRVKYGKKLATAEQKELALSIYHNIIKAEASKTLINKVPNTIKSIRPGLEKAVKDSDEIVKEAFTVLE